MMNQVIEVQKVTIPLMPTRKEVAEVLGLSVEGVRRLDDEKLIRRHPGFERPVRYVGESVRKFAEGSLRKGF